VETDRTDVIAVAPDRLWAVLADVGDYPTFWPWLRSFDGRELAAGVVWRGQIDVAGPLRLPVAIHLDEVVPGRCIGAHLGGDLTGPARVDVTAAGAGSALHLTAALVPRRADLRSLTRWARPLAQASHDRVITRALAHLATHVETHPD